MVMDTERDRRLDAYLNDHLAGSAGAIRLAERYRDRESGTELGAFLAELVPEIERDRDVLQQIMERVGSSPNPVKRAGALGAELLTSLRGRVPMLGAGSVEVARLEEIELLTLGIEGKRLLWKALGRLARSDARLAGFSFTELAKRAKAQRDRLEPFRLKLAREAFGPVGSSR
jgi:hypothetical protein